MESQGYKVTYIQPSRSGGISTSKIIDAISDKTFLVSIMHANNETGVINNINEIFSKLKIKIMKLLPIQIWHKHLLKLI